MTDRTARQGMLFAAALCLGLARQVAAGDAYVATTGNDSNPGTEAQPLRTIQKACDAAQPGTTIYIKAGVYNERVSVNVSGTATAYITVCPYATDAVALDGTGISADANGENFGLTLENRSYVRIKGLEIRNFVTRVNGTLAAGIMVRGAGTGVELRNNHVHAIQSLAAVDSNKNGRDAFGIATYGTNGSQAISGLVVDGNEVDHCTLGSSETVTFNGNVDGFTVSNNTVHDNDNIGICVIGWEGTASANDQAHNGTVRNNLVYNIASYGNPAYGTDRSADGIYCDGGLNNVFEKNICHHCDLGLEVGCEHGGHTASGNIVRNNLLYSNNVTGLAFGGYDTSRGIVLGCQFLNNTLYLNDTRNSSTGEILIQKANGNTVANNIVYCSKQNLLLSNPFSAAYSYNNAFDHNLYFGPGGAANCTWNWNNSDDTGLAAYRTKSGQDAHSIFADPLLVNAPADLHCNAGSPAIDAGAAFTAVTDDFSGTPRPQGAGYDIGAYEFGSGPVAPVITNPPANAMVPAGGTATFSVTASGTGPLAYQWQRNGANIANATTASYTTPPVTLNDTGATFRVLVSNSSGSVTSSSATLTVTPSNNPPAITSPAAAAPNPALAGQTIIFSVGASDADGDALTYAWNFGDGSGAPGSTAPHAYAAAGTFSANVTVTDSAGQSVTSAVPVTIDGPAAYWKFDEGSGASAADSSGNGNTGALVNSPAWIAGQNGSALSFNGKNQAVTIPVAAGGSLEIDAGPVTISAWVNPNTVSVQQAILVRGLSNGVGAGKEGYGLFINSNGKMNVGSTGGGNFDSLVTLKASTWQHVVAVINGGASKIFINGVDRTPASVRVNVIKSTAGLTIGAARNTANTAYVRFFNGALDDVRVYQAALTAQEIAALAGAAAPGTAAVLAEPAALALTVTQGRAALNAHHPEKQSCAIKGIISGLPSGFVLNGQDLALNIGTAEASFTLDAAGRAQSASGVMAVKIKKGTAAFTAKLNGDLAGAWGTGAEARITMLPVTIQIGANVCSSIAAISVNQ